MTTDGLRQVMTLTRSNEWPKEQFTSLSLAQETAFCPFPHPPPPFQQNLCAQQRQHNWATRMQRVKKKAGGEWGVQTNHIWSNASQWLFNWEHALRSIWTVTFRPCLYKSDVPLKGPMNWQLFLALCGVAQGPETLISLVRDGKKKSNTLKTHTRFCRCYLLFPACRPLFLLVARRQ